jgi:hypothetical protein
MTVWSVIILHFFTFLFFFFSLNQLSRIFLSYILLFHYIDSFFTTSSLLSLCTHFYTYTTVDVYTSVYTSCWKLWFYVC